MDMHVHLHVQHVVVHMYWHASPSHILHGAMRFYRTVLGRTDF